MAWFEMKCIAKMEIEDSDCLWYFSLQKNDEILSNTEKMRPANSGQYAQTHKHVGLNE